MKAGFVTVPYVGYYYVKVDDLPDETTEDEAFDLALDRLGKMSSEGISLCSNDEQWLRQLTSDNVNHFDVNEFSVEWEQYDDEELEDDGDPGELKENEDFARDNEVEVNECED